MPSAREGPSQPPAPGISEREASIPFLRAGIASPLLSKRAKHAAVRLPTSAHSPNGVIHFSRNRSTSAESDPLRPKSAIHFDRNRRSTSAETGDPLQPKYPGEVSEHGLASARGRLAARLGRLIDAPPPLEEAERFAKHLANEFPAVFLIPVRPVDRCHQLARRTGHPTGGGHAQGLRRQPHAQGRRHATGAGQRRAHRPPTQARPAGSDHDDAACPHAHRPRRTRAAAALLRPAAAARHLPPTLDSGGSLPRRAGAPEPSWTRPCSTAP